MNFFYRVILIISFSLILISCAKIKVTNISKDKRIILQEFKNSNVKTINQKYHALYGWVNAECRPKNISFKQCADEDVFYKEFAILKIRETQKSNDSFSVKEQPAASLAASEDDGGGSEDDGGSSEDDGGSSEDDGGSSEDDGGGSEDDGGSSEDDGGSSEDDGPPHSPPLL